MWRGALAEIVISRAGVEFGSMQNKDVVRNVVFASVFVGVTAAVFFWRPDRSIRKNPVAPDGAQMFSQNPDMPGQVQTSNRVIFTRITSSLLAARTDEQWDVPLDAVREPQFAAFADWVRRYQAAEEPEKSALQAQGMELARQRRAALFSLIHTDPKRALELSMPLSVREELPGSINALLEERVSGRGDYSVLGVYPLPGQEKEVKPIQRLVALDERQYRAYVYGERLEHPTKRNIPLHGVALDGVMAISESPVRILEASEIRKLRLELLQERFCRVSGQAVTEINEQTPIVDAGDGPIALCNPGHIEMLRDRMLAAAGQPGGSAGEGATAESPYTEGRKKIIMFRVAFSNVTTPAVSSNDCVAILNNMNTFWQRNSYGRTSVARAGEGSDIVQITLPNPSSNYDDDAGSLRTDVRAMASARGIDLTRYDFDVTYTGGGRPVFNFGGLGFIGAPGAWVVGNSTSITAHELGHNLGFPHANFWDTSGQSAIGSGGNEEYGDPYDVMGSGSATGGTGPGHYTSKFKWRIGWIPNADLPRLSSSGTHRIYAHDNPDSRGVRGVRFRRDAALDYFLDFRQLYTGNPWLMNGTVLRWGSTGGSSSQLIDTTPGSVEGKEDAPIVLGRTFSDAQANVHITPVALGNTYPQSIDVVVNFGTFPANQPPHAIVSASTTNAVVNGAITLMTQATDPNNDALAYYWDFGDGTFGANSPSVTKRWNSAGEYIVRCTVSDMKGGQHSDSVVMRVGNPATFRISGRVLLDGKPLEGVLLRASPTRSAYTDSDGTYTITRLTTGSYTVAALLYPYSFVGPFFSSPITVGPSASEVDFLAVLAPLNNVTLVSTGAVWKYLANGSNQGTGWRAPSFNDVSWISGRGQLGYGDDDEATVISFGPNPNNKFITYYFRHRFNVADPSILTNFTLNILRDDGALVYLNGAEILRDNLPGGTVSYTTTAIDNSEDTTSITIDSSLIQAGTNVLAVEVHQVSGTSSDLSFDLSLFATAVTNYAGLTAFYLARPGDNARFTAPADIALGANAKTTGDPFVLVEFLADGEKLGEDMSSPFTFTWEDAPIGDHVLTVRGIDSASNATTSAPVRISVLSADPLPGITLTAPTNGASFVVPVMPTLAAGAVANPGQAIVNIEFYADGLLLGEDAAFPYSLVWSNPPPGVFSITALAHEDSGVMFTSAPALVTIVAPPSGQQLVSARALWRYLDDGSDQGIAWRNRSFDDSDWHAGHARLGYGGDGEYTMVSFGPTPTRRYITTYFRHAFLVNSLSGIDQLRLLLSADDGAVVYLNGTEVHRRNLRSGLVSYNSLATSGVDGAAETNFASVSISSSPLIVGTNVLAVEVHQLAINSPDLGLDLALIAESNTNLTQGVYLTSPANGAHITMPSEVEVSAFVAPADGTMTRIEFYADGTKLGEDDTAPYTFFWSGATAGAYELTAVAHRTTDGAMTSPSVNVTVGPPPLQISSVFTAFVEAGTRWRYWDTGVTPAPDWASRDYHDDAWAQGLARLGWGLDGEETALQSGRITHYFRQAFSVNNPALYETLVLQLQRDDGAIVYLNGFEILRSNMAGGPVTSNTLALATLDALDEQQFVIAVLPAGGLFAGTNILAVELHQASANSSDGGFDLHFSGSGNTAPRLVLGSPADNAFFAAPATVFVEAYAWAGSGRSITKVKFFADGVEIGERTEAPYQVTLNNVVVGNHIITAQATDNFGAVIDTALIRISVGYPAVAATFISAGATWKFLDNGANPGATWAQRAYNDTVWRSGAAQLGYGDGDETTVVSFGPSSGNKYITTYFRRWFEVPSDTSFTNLTVRLLRDDGAVVWLNGREMYRSNMPATGTITFNTLASDAVADADEDTYFITSLAITNLLAGTNLVAVEIHQNTANSSDISFDLELTGTGYSAPVIAPELAVALLPNSQVEISWPAPSDGWALYYSATLADASWTRVAIAPSTRDEQNVVTLTPSDDTQFYRLQR